MWLNRKGDMENDECKNYYDRGIEGRSCKSVSTYNLAYSLQKIGKKVLAVDFDSRANLFTCFGVENTEAVPVTIGDLMMAMMDEEELSAPEAFIQTRNGVDFISPSMILSAVDAKLRLEMGLRECWRAFRDLCAVDMINILIAGSWRPHNQCAGGSG